MELKCWSSVEWSGRVECSCYCRVELSRVEMLEFSCVELF